MSIERSNGGFMDQIITIPNSDGTTRESTARPEIATQDGATQGRMPVLEAIAFITKGVAARRNRLAAQDRSVPKPE